MKVGFWNISALAAFMFSSFSAFALVNLSDSNTELGRGINSDILCATGQVQEVAVNQARYFIKVEQDYDERQDETIAVFDIGVSYIKNQRNLINVTPNDQTKMELGDADFKRICPKYISQTQTGLTVSAKIEMSYPGIQKFSNFEAPATPQGLELFAKALAEIEQKKGGFIHSILNPSILLSSSVHEGHPMGAIVRMSGNVDLKILEEIAKEWSEEGPLSSSDHDGLTQFSATPNLE